MPPLPRFAASVLQSLKLRQAWLRPQYASLYPEIPPETWVTAPSAARTVIGAVYSGTTPWACQGPRVLGQDHFIFREESLGRQDGRSRNRERMIRKLAAGELRMKS